MCLVSHGKLKKKKKPTETFKRACSPSHVHLKALDRFPKVKGTNYVAWVSLIISPFFQKQRNYCDLDNHPTVVYYSLVMALRISS